MRHFVEAPEAAESPEVYGDAQWVKVYKTQLTREANLDELVSDNTVVPQDAAHVEVQWEIVQVEPVSNSNGSGNRQHRRNSETLNFDTRSVLRRYETYAFTGAYDPTTHEALCADLLCKKKTFTNEQYHKRTFPHLHASRRNNTKLQNSYIYGS